jgi:hypothetical protein
MSVGRIPWSKVMEFADRHHLDEEAASILWRVLFIMDDGFAEWMKGEHERAVRHSKSGSKKGTGNRRAYKR